MKKFIFTFALIPVLLSVIVWAKDKNDRYLDFPEGYEESFTHYHTMNRAGKELVAKMYANDKALESLSENNKTGPGSVIVMEVYKPLFNEDGKPLTDDNGIYRTDKLAAIAVMEKRDEWHPDFPENELLGNWGFTIFKTDMTPTHKDNSSDNVNCVSCHTPLKDTQDSLFTYSELVEHVRNNTE